jgi:hypothetical protein
MHKFAGNILLLNGNKLVPDPLGKPEAKRGAGTPEQARARTSYRLSEEVFRFSWG